MTEQPPRRPPGRPPAEAAAAHERAAAAGDMAADRAEERGHPPAAADQRPVPPTSTGPSGTPAADRRTRGIALAVAARRGDTLAMNDLLDHLIPFVSAICGPIALSSRQDAVQETLVAVFRALRTLDEPEALYSWVRAVAVREAVRVARRDARTLPVEPIDLQAPGDPQLAADIGDVVARLSPEHRAVLVLRDVEGLDEREAAELLGVPEGTVKSRLHRARAGFRRMWSS
ncbi:RNA polymerase sigma factor [Yinghuangia sp. YIM S09857]|uniref:RNA polymerase sigma factor n=1 Tax=Yinghuangia sp. YIM S09857 TaxID=3436929 RepID=UPI003F531485